jgi:hypothetical protein
LEPRRLSEAIERAFGSAPTKAMPPPYSSPNWQPALGAIQDYPLAADPGYIRELSKLCDVRVG